MCNSAYPYIQKKHHSIIITNIFLLINAKLTNIWFKQMKHIILTVYEHMVIPILVYMWNLYIYVIEILRATKRFAFLSFFFRKKRIPLPLYMCVCACVCARTFLRIDIGNKLKCKRKVWKREVKQNDWNLKENHYRQTNWIQFKLSLSIYVSHFKA